MFWDQVAGVYGLFVHVVNRKTHRALRRIVAGLVGPQDRVLECACGTGLLSAAVAPGCRHLTATDFAPKMLEKAQKNCAAYGNITFALADVTALRFPDHAFDRVIAGNVMHLLDRPLQALRELNRVCAPGGTLIVPTYINRERNAKTGGFVSAAGRAGAGFKRQFTLEGYRRFFVDAGYGDVRITLAQGWIPCAVAVMQKKPY